MNVAHSTVLHWSIIVCGMERNSECSTYWAFFRLANSVKTMCMRCKNLTIGPHALL